MVLIPTTYLYYTYLQEFQRLLAFFVEAFDLLERLGVGVDDSRKAAMSECACVGMG